MVLHLVRKGELALPEFQREFVWEPNAVVELIESITNGWPIGSLLILEGPQPFGIRSIKGAPAPSEEGVQYYLLDGQQRVTSIFHALTGTGDVTYVYDFSGHSDDEVSLRWIKNEKGIVKPETITLVDYLDDETHAFVTAEWSSPARRRAARMRDELIGVLIEDSYRVPATVMAEDIELEALTRIFETLNRTGMRLNAFDLVVASQYSPEYSLRDRWNELRDSQKVLNDFSVDGIEPLKLLALRYMHSRVGVEFRTSSRRPVAGVRQRDVLNLPPEVIRKYWEPTVLQYADTLRFLREHAGVSDSNSLPSKALVLTLSYWRAEHVPDALLSHWYWRAIATQRYSQGANTQVVSDTGSELPGPPSIARDVSAGQLSEAMFDSPRRNKMLRMGLRGLAITRGFLDPLTGVPLSADVRELDVQQLQAIGLGVGSPEPTIEGTLWASESSTRKIRVAARQSTDLRSIVRADALESQHLAFNEDGTITASGRAGQLIELVMDEA